MEITKVQFEASYLVAKRVFAGDLEKEAGAELLNKEVGMNIGSARDYINAFDQMMKGLGFKRTINAHATDYYFSTIYKDFGAEFLALAISSVQKHVEYYEGVREGTLHKLREILERHSALLSKPVDLESYQIVFSKSVEKSFEDPTETRRKRLKISPKHPTKTLALSIIFVRNPDVVAEVLHRAGGNCERCNSPAPFRRKRDHSPYLEVHHTIRLADGGEDSVENAKTLCPNCHRELHFGLGD